ncbi:MAG: hypothetical protein XD98_0391 [Microgenomates bacterium 39_6]|nr:MAG: hypothetical protein XD98_0391 [Microgenomates bacterium 39_6]
MVNLLLKRSKFWERSFWGETKKYHRPMSLGFIYRGFLVEQPFLLHHQDRFY